MPDQGANAVLEARSLCKSYGGRQILSDVSFALYPGQSLGLTGSNGSGKSTLLRLLAQIERPDSGDVCSGGRSVLGDRHFLRRRLGYVPQDNELTAELTVEQQLGLWLSACGLGRRVPNEVLELLELRPLLRQRVGALSGGTQRRVSIALALLAGPDVVIMDESSAGLDAVYHARLLDWLSAYVRSGGALLWCSHDAEELDRLCTHRLCLNEGKAYLKEITGPADH